MHQAHPETTARFWHFEATNPVMLGQFVACVDCKQHVRAQPATVCAPSPAVTLNQHPGHRQTRSQIFTRDCKCEVVAFWEQISTCLPVHGGQRYPYQTVFLVPQTCERKSFAGSCPSVHVYRRTLGGPFHFSPTLVYPRAKLSDYFLF